MLFRSVNPSIEVKVSEKEKVLDLVALNEDGKKVLGDMDFKGSQLEVAVNVLIGSMLRNGYLTELSNSILISVNNDNESKGVELQQKLMEEVNNLLQSNTFEGSVLTQTVVGNTELEQLAEQYGITVGKAQLIHDIITQNQGYNFDNLVPLSINEIGRAHV